MDRLYKQQLEMWATKRFSLAHWLANLYQTHSCPIRRDKTWAAQSSVCPSLTALRFSIASAWKPATRRPIQSLTSLLSAQQFPFVWHAIGAFEASPHRERSATSWRVPWGPMSGDTLERVMAKLLERSAPVISIAFLVMNAEKILRLLRRFFVLLSMLLCLAVHSTRAANPGVKSTGWGSPAVMAA